MNFEEFEREQTGKPAEEQEAQEVSEAQEVFTPEAAQVYVETDEDGQKVIRIRPREYDPALDPDSPDFDKEKWKELQKQTQESFNAAMQALDRMVTSFTDAGDALIAAMKTETWQGLGDTLKMIAAAAPLLREIEKLTPYLKAELKKPEYNGKTIDELLEEAETDEDGNPTESSLFMQALTAARAAQAETAVEGEIDHANIKRAEIIEYPLDKPNSIIWNLLEGENTKGQISLAFEMAASKDKRKGSSLPVYYAINFEKLSDDLQITKRLQPFDKLVYIATGALFNAGNNIITLSQIYYAMGYTGTPGDTDREKIYKSITKMRTADIFFDNEQEAKKYNYIRFRYEGAVLPCEIKDANINGMWTDKAIHIFREPPLISFAKQRKQITTLPIKLLQAPVSKTDANLRIQDYLLERLETAKHDKIHGKVRMLYKTIYEKTNITTKKQAQRAPEKIKKYLKFYQEQNHISKFTLESDGITIYW